MKRLIVKRVGTLSVSVTSKEFHKNTGNLLYYTHGLSTMYERFTPTTITTTTTRIRIKVTTVLCY